MRILFLSQYFPPEMGAPAARVSELSRFWIEAGAQVTVVTTFPNHPTGTVPPEYRGKIFQEECSQGIRVLRAWIFITPNKGFLKRVIGFLTFMVSSTLVGVFRSGPCDLVVATSPQIFCGLAGWLVSALRRKPFVLEVRDLWPDSAIELGVLRNPLLIRLSRGLERFLYRRADLVVPVSQSIRACILSQGVPESRVEAIPNGIDPQLFVPGDRHNSHRESLGLKQELLVTYIGTHGISHGLENVVRAAELLKEDSSVHFLFIGAGAEKERVVQLASDLGLKNVTFLPPQPKKDIPGWLAASDLSLVSLLDLPVFQTVLPSKMFEIMACARPVVLVGKGESVALIESAGAGISVPPGQPEDLARTLKDLGTQPDLRAEMGRRGREFVIEHFDRTALARRYLDRMRLLLEA